MSQGKLPHVKTISTLLTIHGVLMVGLGLLYCIFVPVGAASGEEPGFIAFMGCLGLVTPLIGALQIFAGRGLRERKFRMLAILSAMLGAYGSCIALCLPASLLLACGVAFVLIDPEVKRSFGD